ncbi:YdeI/OmpD-associated family protein [Emticicia fontis]
MEVPLIDGKYTLKKYEGKGGWTYAEIPEIPQDKRSPFGWVRVRGTIDDFEISAYNLMPMGNGKLFLAVKLEIRKKIKKEAGDEVHIILFADDLPTEIPEELKECMQNELGIYEKFLSYSDGEKKAFIDWIYSAKTEETKADRIVKTLEKIEKGQKFYR